MRFCARLGSNANTANKIMNIRDKWVKLRPVQCGNKSGQ